MLAIEISGIRGWATDRGKSLEEKMENYGGVSFWSWSEEESGDKSVCFKLTLVIGEGCVEEAIASAGGPKVQCG